MSTCLSTIIACTWSIQHLNIPAIDDSGWEKNKRKVKWMMITVLFPELVLIHAMFEFYMAWTALRLMGNKQKSVEWPWWSQMLSFSWLPSRRRDLDSKDKDLESQDVGSLESQDARSLESQDVRSPESQYLRGWGSPYIGLLESEDSGSLENQDVGSENPDIGLVNQDVGLVNQDVGLESHDVRSLEGDDETKKRKWTLAHCYFANMGGFMYTKGGKRFLVTAQQLAMVKGLSYANPEITVEDIKDKSKQDWLAKLFAALQISQLILSIITRHIQGVPFSQLETVTLSFAICGVLIYCAYFHKPQNIARAIEFKDDTHETAAWFSTLQSEKTYDSLWAIMRNKAPSSKEINLQEAGSKKTDDSKC